MIRVQVINGHRRYHMGRRRLAGYARRVLRERRVERADLRIVCIDSRYARTLNRAFLGHDYVTDVISFPLEGGTRLEGEIYVNLDRARSQARDYGISFANEVARLVIHGTLHLLGYDDRRMRDAKRMRTREDAHIQFWFPHNKGK
jgi:rRNA maturation RNase YbeY